MLVDLRHHEDGAELETELCVIGGGAAGIAIALEFLDGGADVVVLESGGLRLSRQTERLNEGEAVGIDPRSLTAGRARVLGGTTALWVGQCLPADPETFTERSWVPDSGWPFGLAELHPFYRRAERILRIEGELYDERIWDGFGVERPRLDPCHLVHRFSVWCPHLRLGRIYRSRLSRSKNLRVLLHATATELLTSSAGDQFDSVRVATPEGKTVRIRARACVLCTGAIENARLLLASTSQHTGGIGNRHGVVGRYFQEHASGHAARIVGGDVARLQELYGIFYRGGVRYLPRLVLSPEMQRDEQVLSCAAIPLFHFGEDSGVEAARRVHHSLKRRRRPSLLRQDLRLVARDLPRLASIAHQRISRGRSARLEPASMTLQTHVEQAPNRESRVRLGRRRDAHGIPLPVIEWKRTELDRRTVEVMVREVREEFSRLGLGDVRPAPWLAQSSWRERLMDSFHHMGTTRMGEDPETSVVDSDCQIHDVTGLFVAGSSVFPASGYVNPTLTIIALAIRLADHLKGVLETRPA
jgi:choline dehydrogenase-like flavoprotein